MNNKERWVLKHIPKVGVDILNADWVDAYIESFNAPHRICNWGANKCPQLGKLLSQMYKKNILNRGVIALGRAWQPGFPKWVYTYAVADEYRAYADNL